jgi:hypothetical protein
MSVAGPARTALPQPAGSRRRSTARRGNRRLRALAALLVPRRTPAPSPPVANDGPVVLVLPVLPDLSHTFVYREVLALLRQRPDWHVVVLADNPQAPVHAEAAELLKRVQFLRRDGVLRAACARDAGC